MDSKRMWRAGCAAALMVLSIAVPAGATNVPGGWVAGTWTLAGSPYDVTGDIAVHPGTTLTIQPGVVVRFLGHYRFTVAGRLVAIGTSSKMITFMSPLHSGWYGLRFHDQTQNAMSYLHYCILENAVKGVNTGVSADINGGAVYLQDYSDLRITCSTIRGNQACGDGGGIYCLGSDPLIRKNTICDNRASNGGAIMIRACSPAVIDNLITQNEAESIGGGISGESSGSIIQGNILARNKAGSGGGGLSFANNTGATTLAVMNNEMTDNHTCYGGGAAFAQLDGGAVTVSGNTIAANIADSNGGGIFITDCESLFLKGNTISRNITTGTGTGIPAAVGGGVCVWEHSTLYSEQNFIEYNQALYGGGIGAYDEGTYLCSTKDVIRYNSAQWCGGGIETGGPDNAFDIVNALIVRNSADEGGGIAAGEGFLDVVNSTICDNTANNGGGFFQGWYPDEFTLTNCIVSGNTAAAAGAQVYMDFQYYYPETRFEYCDVEGGHQAFGGPGAGTNYNAGAYYTPFSNIDAPPQFAGGTGLYPYSLSPASPCINAGGPNTGGLNLPAMDLANNPRVSGARIDIGAYEYQISPTPIPTAISAGGWVPKSAAAPTPTPAVKSAAAGTTGR